MTYGVGVSKNRNSNNEVIGGVGDGGGEQLAAARKMKSVSRARIVAARGDARTALRAAMYVSKSSYIARQRAKIAQHRRQTYRKMRK